jgi:hypothetical protein
MEGGGGWGVGRGAQRPAFIAYEYKGRLRFLTRKERGCEKANCYVR